MLVFVGKEHHHWDYDEIVIYSCRIFHDAVLILNFVKDNANLKIFGGLWKYSVIFSFTNQRHIAKLFFGYIELLYLNKLHNSCATLYFNKSQNIAKITLECKQYVKIKVYIRFRNYINFYNLHKILKNINRLLFILFCITCINFS